MPATYDKIATYTVPGGGASSYTFSSIPSTYTDLIIVVNFITSPANYINFQFNGDTGNNYSFTYLRGDGTSAVSGRASNIPVAPGATAASPGQIVAQLMNYSNTTTNKTMLVRSGVASNDTRPMVDLWRNTAAVNSVTILGDSPITFSSGSTFTLYGIKAA